jgi:recombination protein RecA
MTITADIENARAAAFDSFLGTQKRKDPGNVLRLSDPGILGVEVVSTGAISLDVAIGAGGFPLGRIIELYGPEMSGKTSLALQVAANVQRTRNGAVGFIDAENALNLNHVSDMGVDLSRIALHQPGSGEEGIDMVEQMIASSAFDMIIVDSIAAMTPQGMIDGSIEEPGQMGQHARLMGRFMARVAHSVKEQNVMLVLINQLREKPGVSFGNPEYVTGGRAIKFYASLRIEVRSGSASSKLKAGSLVIGQTTKAKVTKNKVGPPFREAEYDLFFGQGIDTAGSMLEVGKDLDVLKLAGNTWSVISTGDVLGGSKAAAKKGLRDNPELSAVVEKEIYEVLQNGKPVPTTLGAHAAEEAPVAGADADADAGELVGARV